MKINIYYGGRGVIDDPTIYVIQKMEAALTEINVDVQRINIYERKNEISVLPQTLKDVDGIILATTIEWMGIGGYMTQFLDACWYYGDKEKISEIYMQPVAISTTYGEREGVLTLENAWEILGGLPCSGLSGYVEDIAAFESNTEYVRIIEKKAEYLYRTIKQKSQGLPTSNQAVTQRILRSQQLELTQQESDQLSELAADDEFVHQQKQNIIELSYLYKNMMGEHDETSDLEYISSFRSHFVPMEGFKASYRFEIEEKEIPLMIRVDQEDISCVYADEEADILAKVSAEVLEDIIAGRKTFQGAFAMGDMKARGLLPIIHKLDKIFNFGEEG